MSARSAWPAAVMRPTCCAAGVGSSGIVASRDEKPRMLVSGVRSSWLILARKTVLASAAACRRASSSRRAVTSRKTLTISTASPLMSRTMVEAPSSQTIDPSAATTG
ncbi:MAG: hypothetical protein A2882_15435 [Phenylobacterium sp. RIFCSPHIGHO2_01_FULL_70_10]|nr:MAG: hypothetical protein A2882_15435 [Phenylobacterium sp. RIFCSPHIGHO2_01_FULL_70_10]